MADDKFLDSHAYGFETRAIRAGQPHDPTSGAVVTPISMATTFAQPAPGEHRGYEYSRTGNPTRSALEANLAALEGAEHGLAFASGMAASDTVLRGLRPGDHLVLGNDAYGGTYRLIARVIAPMGITFSTVDLTDPAALAAAWTPATKLVWLETPTNPLLTAVDIQAVADVAHANGGICVVDNTFATPYLQQPLSLGADIVVHSTTKYLGGHSDVVGGFIATNSIDLRDQFAFMQNGAGAVPGPMDAYLTLRGIKTLAVRMDRQCDNAEALVELLTQHDAVSTVLYPGLASTPGHEAAAKQMKRFGGMISFRVAAGRDAAMRLTSATEVFTLAESLGAVESLIEHPGVMTHASVEGSPLQVPDDLIRLSVGIETLADLEADLTTALDSVA